jgi:putative transposase
VTNYRRSFICGGSFFFTANLAERRLCLLVDYIDLLRQAADNRSRFGER